LTDYGSVFDELKPATFKASAMDVIAAVTGAVALAKQILDLSAVSKDSQAKAMVGDLRLQLAELKIKLADLIEENDQLKRDAKKAQAAPAMTVKDGMYYKPDGDGPFCTTCHDSSGKLIRLVPLMTGITRIGKWHCGVCKTPYGR
jgi:hypothetical protein